MSKPRLMLAAFWVLFGVFLLNVLLGKAAVTFGWEGLPLLSDVAEFLLLLAAMVIFVVAALQREAARRNRTPYSRNETREDRT